MIQFLYGMNSMGFVLAGLFFWRFWRKSAETIFVFFSAAFLLFALDQLFHAVRAAPASVHDWPFLFRLAGFGLLIYGVLKKNLK